MQMILYWLEDIKKQDGYIPYLKTGLPLEGIKQERTLLEELKGRAQKLSLILQGLNPRSCGKKFLTEFSINKQSTFTVNVMSFGFKHGLPIDAEQSSI